MSNAQDRIDHAVALAGSYAQIDGGHHKMWVIDQMLQVLLGDDYEEWVAEYQEEQEDGEIIYEWDTGIAP